MKSYNRLLAATTALVAVAVTGQAFAAAVIINASGTNVMGINDTGEHNVRNGTSGISTSNASFVGIARKDDAAFGAFGRSGFQDATAPGCQCEGWGVSVGGVAGGASVDNSDPGNLTLIHFLTDATAGTPGSFAESKVSLTSLPGITITQHYRRAPDTDLLFEDIVTITNNTGATVSDVRYVRAMDWDIPPSEFAEHVTIQGTATTTFLELSHDDGFANVNPLAATGALLGGTTNVDFTDSGPSDHGAYFKFNFGDLADGASRVFSIFYGAAPSEAAALGAIGEEAIELFSLGQSSNGSNELNGTPATFIFGFRGVGGTAVIDDPTPTRVPEPGTMGLLGFGLAGLALLRRRQSASA
jgi:type IV pilus assembly protein PilY1